MPQVGLCWFLFMTGEEGMRQGATPRRSRPRDRDRKGPYVHWRNAGKAGGRWVQTLNPQAGRPASTV